MARLGTGPGMLIQVSRIKRLAHNRGRRVSGQFLTVLNDHVHNLVARACSIHNGGKKTLDAAIAGLAGAKV